MRGVGGDGAEEELGGSTEPGQVTESLVGPQQRRAPVVWPSFGTYTCGSLASHLLWVLVPYWEEQLKIPINLDCRMDGSVSDQMKNWAGHYK